MDQLIKRVLISTALLLSVTALVVSTMLFKNQAVLRQQIGQLASPVSPKFLPPLTPGSSNTPKNGKDRKSTRLNSSH